MSLDSSIAALHKNHSDLQDKYTYFLLAAVGAAIAFAVQKTEGLPLSWWLLPVGLSTVAWAASFYVGCRNIEWVGSTVLANYALLQLQAGVHPNQPPHPQLTEVAMQGTRIALDRNADRVQFYGKWQFRLFLFGVAMFIVWRVLEMWRITQ